MSDPRIPPGGRLAGAALVAVAVASWVVSPTITGGRPLATVLMSALIVATGIAGLVLAALPGRAARVLQDLGIPPKALAVAAAALLFLDVLVVLGTPLVYATAGLERIAAGEAGGAYTPVVPSLPELTVRRVAKLVIWTAPIVAFLAWAREGSLHDVADALGLTGGARELLAGAIWTVPVYLALTGIAQLLASLGIGSGGGGTVPIVHAVLISVTAGLGEEVFFRGFLQPRIGLLPQAIWFSLEHAAYLSITSLVGALAAGIILGLAYRRSGSLVVPITAHALYDIVVLGFV